MVTYIGASNDMGDVMETVCISLGGSVISRKDGINAGYVGELSKTLLSHGSRHKFVITVGGGFTCREYINSARNIIRNDHLLDNVGIFATRLNVALVKNAFMDAGLDVHPVLIERLEEIESAISRSGIVVSGGMFEGITTDAVCTIAAEMIGSRTLVNISSSSHIYDRHPSIKGARMLKSMSYGRMARIAAKWDDRKPGSNFVFDIEACRIAKRSGIRIYFVGADVRELDNILNGRPHDGTVVGGTTRLRKM